MKKSQKDFVIKQLRENGQVSRNTCLQNFITRLGAIICQLKDEGYDFEAKYIKTDKGQDYVYKLKTNPFKKVEYRVDGKLVATRWEK